MLLHSVGLPSLKLILASRCFINIAIASYLDLFGRFAHEQLSFVSPLKFEIIGGIGGNGAGQ